MKKVVVVFLMFLLTGCTPFMFGWTQPEALYKYMYVDPDSDNFGTKRFKYVVRYFKPLQGFVEEKGMPHYFYEYKNGEGNDGYRLYYLDIGEVYIYEAKKWRYDSIYLKDHRSMNSKEIEQFCQSERYLSTISEREYVPRPVCDN